VPNVPALEGVLVDSANALDQSRRGCSACCCFGRTQRRGDGRTRAKSQRHGRPLGDVGQAVSLFDWEVSRERDRPVDGGVPVIGDSRLRAV
jgi:hypothetical protein